MITYVNPYLKAVFTQTISKVLGRVCDPFLQNYEAYNNNNCSLKSLTILLSMCNDIISIEDFSINQSRSNKISLKKICNILYVNDILSSSITALSAAIITS